jgi:hypothetical protein
VKRAGIDELAMTLCKLNELVLSDEVALNIIGHDPYFASSPVLLLSTVSAPCLVRCK